ncbi:MAG: hypothetical protein GPOALKHO_000067 [Sodalis sp.]|nr:MAG: hypothetical protein GPOALKHO_000067 [Sodalis sp.]
MSSDFMLGRCVCWSHPYFFNKHLCRRFHHLPLMPLIFTPAALILLLVLTYISY